MGAAFFRVSLFSSNCLRFANPAEANWRPEAGTVVALARRCFFCLYYCFRGSGIRGPWVSMGSHQDTLRTHLGTPSLYLESPGAPHGFFFGFGRDFTKNVKIIQKRWFSDVFFMISEVLKASKSKKNIKKSNLESSGPPKNRQRRARSIGMAAHVANASQMLVQWGSNGTPGRLRITNG